jgi:hypothetical protein
MRRTDQLPPDGSRQSELVRRRVLAEKILGALCSVMVLSTTANAMPVSVRRSVSIRRGNVVPSPRRMARLQIDENVSAFACVARESSARRDGVVRPRPS